MFSEQQQEIAKTAVDGVSVVIAVGAVMEWLPAVAALFTIVWTGLRIWEMKTVRGWFRRKK